MAVFPPKCVGQFKYSGHLTPISWQGRAVAGSLDALIAAVRDGRTIKVSQPGVWVNQLVVATGCCIGM
jgi:hypothetical protein